MSCAKTGGPILTIYTSYLLHKAMPFGEWGSQCDGRHFEKTAISQQRFDRSTPNFAKWRTLTLSTTQIPVFKTSRWRMAAFWTSSQQ